MLELLLLLVFCVLIGLGCLGAIAWVVLSGEEIGVERIFLVIVSFLVASLFLGIAGWIITRSPLRTMGKPEAAANPKSAPASKQKAAPEEASKSAS